MTEAAMTTPVVTLTTTPRQRLTSLDQFRGYTMFGMLLVNFLGGYLVCPPILRHHHDYCSYADTIMPQFLFAAGFAMRLSLSRRIAAGGQLPWGRIVRRILGLAVVAIVWYSICDWNSLVERLQSQPFAEVLGQQLKRGWFQTLMHIAVTSLWIVPVIAAGIRVRVCYGVASVLLHIVLSWAFNFAWVNSSPNGIDGGPLGFLTWSVPALAGTIAADWVHAAGLAATRRLVLGGGSLMLIAWLASNLSVLYDVTENPATAATVESRFPKFASDPVVPASERWRRWDGDLIEPPFVPPPPAERRQWNYWMMSQRSGSLTYTTFAAGLSLLIYAVFLNAADGRGWQIGVFRTLGKNSLAAYILHDIAGWIVSPWFPENSPSVALTAAGFGVFFLAVYLPCRLLEWKQWYLRV